MDNVITFVPKEVKDDRSIEDRIYDCFHANIAFDESHKKSCPYCIHNRASSDMIFDILTKDMTLASKNKNLTLTTYDLKTVLSNVLQIINETEYAMVQKREAEKATGIRKGSMRSVESGQQKAQEGDSEPQAGITTITPTFPSSRED